MCVSSPSHQHSQEIFAGQVCLNDNAFFFFFPGREVGQPDLEKCKEINLVRSLTCRVAHSRSAIPTSPRAASSPRGGAGSTAGSTASVPPVVPGACIWLGPRNLILQVPLEGFLRFLTPARRGVTEHRATTSARIPPAPTAERQKWCFLMQRRWQARLASGNSSPISGLQRLGWRCSGGLYESWVLSQGIFLSLTAQTRSEK